MNIQIYIANLGAYNAGHLIGKWISLPDENVWEHVQEILSAVDVDDNIFGEEHAIHDYEAPFCIHEYDSIDNLNSWAKILEKCNEDEAVISAILGNFCTVSEGITILENGSYRVFSGCNTMEDVAREIIDEYNALDALPDHLRMYFDFQSYGRDMEGSYIRYEGGFVEVY